MRAWSGRPAVLDRILGRLWPGHDVQKGGAEHLVHCPYCAGSGAKCPVNTQKGVFQCWSCGESGTAYALLHHLRDQGHITASDVDAATGKRGAPAALSDSIREAVMAPPKVEEVLWTEDEPCVLPDGFFQLSDEPCGAPERRMAGSALAYLRRRGVSVEDASGWDIHVCFGLGSRYHGHLLFPVLDGCGRRLVFWTTRTVLRTQPKSLHPSRRHSRHGARDVLFGLHTVREGVPVALCEGPFDALAVAREVGMPAVAAFGKILHPAQAAQLAAAGPSAVYVCLDADAVDAARMAADRMRASGVRARVVELSHGDPDDVSPEELVEAFDKASRRPGVGMEESDQDLPAREYWDPSLLYPVV